MDNVPQLGTAADLEIRASRIADPSIDLKTKHTVACELREMIDTVRDAESTRVFPHMIPVILELLRSGEAAFQKDSLDYQFRKVLLEIIHRIPYSDGVRPQALPLFHGMLHLLRHDNEENGVTCCKTIIDLVRSFRCLNEELVSEFMGILQDVLRNMSGLINDVLSESSPQLDSNTVLPSIRSFKVLSEMEMVVVTFSQNHRPLVVPVVQQTAPLNFEVLALESPIQKKAREDYEAMGGYWAGMAPGIKNTFAYVDFITAQIKMVSYLAYVMRGIGDQFEPYAEILLVSCLRLLQDCPANAVGVRRDLMIVMRHLVGTNSRRALLSQIDKLFNERVLLGTGVGSRETLRANGYTGVADLVHHLRNDLNPIQLARIAHVYSKLIHSPQLTATHHMLFGKMMFNLVDVIVSKDTPEGATRVLEAMFETCVDRLEATSVMLQEIFERREAAKNEKQVAVGVALIERSRPVAGAVYAIEKPEEIIHENRLFLRTFLHGFRACLGALRKLDAPTPDGTLIFRLFEGCIRCMAVFDNENRPNETNEAMEWFAGVLIEVNPHVFQEVWTQKTEFFFQAVQKRTALMHFCQVLFARDVSSPILVAIILKFLVGKLPMLGDVDDLTAVATIRMFKMTFSAVALFPHANEPILASHLSKLIMDCFPLAAKASKPANYFHLLRALFRAIGGGGGRFELLYKEVLPLLPEMLESLNKQLLSSEGPIRDMIVELCLTVPLRLTHLLPHLTYLMQPLALALRGGSELVSQGLRTLELCIDNLTPAFLDPTLGTVLRELMEALHGHLKPLPANHHHAHTTIRILGKLGGRNRRLLTRDPALPYKTYSEPAKVAISFGGSIETIWVGPMSALAANILRKQDPTHRVQSYNFLEQCAVAMMYEGIKGRDSEEVFIRSLEGAFDSVHFPEVQEQAVQFIGKVSQYVFEQEIRKVQSKDAGSRRFSSPLLIAFLDAVPHALARENPNDAKKAQELISSIIRTLVVLGSQANASHQDIVPTLHQLASRFSSMCLDDSWIRKSAGCNGIKIITHLPDLGVKWIGEREVDLVRTLLHLLKDLPTDSPNDINNVVDVLTRILRASNGEIDESPEAATNSRNKLLHLIGIFSSELWSSSPVVRQAAQTCISLLEEISGKTAYELLYPHRDRILMTIYAKPLRALTFSIQIGIIEAVRYCVSLEPPLAELNDELLRLLHESLALADADDAALIGRVNPRQGGIDIIKLRVACIKLLTASMPMTDFFSKQHQTRQRVTSVYFKSLYSPSTDVKEVAHEGLRMVLTHQSRLPKELLQTGLRPILMNLADPKRLSVPGLEGLARLLELLTNYFKVEIGHKLLDHFRIVAEPQMLQAASRLPLADNEGITKLVRLANIFHLLPAAANIFLENLVNVIVQTEAHMHFSGQSPFSEPLAKYLDRYPAEGIDFFMRHIHLPRHLRTLRSMLQARLAPNLERELDSQTAAIVTHCLQGGDPNLVLPALLLFQDMADIVPMWITKHEDAITALLHIWRSETLQEEQSAVTVPEVIQRHRIILSLFQKALEQSPRIDLLFDIVSVYARNLALDLVRTTNFLYTHVALNDDLIYRRNVLMRFLTWFDDSSNSWSHKSYFIRLIVTPTLLVHASRTDNQEGLIDGDFIARVHRAIWYPMTEDIAFSEADDMFKIELLHLTTIIVQHYSGLVVDVKKDIIKCAWHYITSDDAIVKPTAYLLAARFFEAFDTPQKFILRAWTGLLRPPHSEARNLTRQALEILGPVLPRSNSNELGLPQWAKTTRRLLAEEGNGFSQMMMIYHLIVRQPQLFFPVRALFIPHMVNSLSKLGLSSAAAPESRLLSIEILQTIFDWEIKSASPEGVHVEGMRTPPNWITPVGFRETMVSYLVRLATAPVPPQEAPARAVLVPRALSLLQLMVGPTGWEDVTVHLNYFARALEQNELNAEAAIAQALSSAKVLQVIGAGKSDSWYLTNAMILQKLVRKGMVTEEYGLHDALHPLFERLLKLFPLPKEEEVQQSEMVDFHSFIYSAVGDGLGNTTSLRGTLLMLKSVVQVTPERVESFSASLVKLLSKLAKEHIQNTPNSNGYDNGVSLMSAILDICQTSIAHLGDQRRWLVSTMIVLIEKSKSPLICRLILDQVRVWALQKQDLYPNMKEKVGVLQKMAAFEHRGDPLFQSYLELIYEIYTDPALRRGDLTNRLEQSFLLGCRARDPALRERFVDLLDSSIPRSLSSRLSYILAVQSWEALSDCNWVFLALHLLLGSADSEAPVSTDRKAVASPLLPKPRAQQLLRPMQRLLFLDAQAAHDTWVSVFPAAWSCLSRREQADVTHHTITLLSKDYHIKQAEIRPNVIQTLLTGAHACSPPMTLPPHLVKYLAKTYGAWHIALEILEATLEHVRDDEASIRDTVFDSLAEVYAELAEDDLFYGLWRRRCLHQETNIAIAFEQHGMWDQASAAYEAAQNKAKAGTIPFSEQEYCLWEDHWVLSAEKLQQWDNLHELAKSEANQELLLESAWRTKDWAENREMLEEQISLLPEVATPRKRIFEAFIALLKLPAALEKNVEFAKILEDAMQLSLRKWVGLPPHLSFAHVPLLQHFQQFVELQEAVQIFGSLSLTNAQNLERKSADLKMVLQAWRERLPNLSDDISIWSDLVAWRQNVFNAINQAYIPLISNGNSNGGAAASSTSNTYGYRGYHETAWIINRFAHVARKHDLLDVCFSSLNKIYTLPNIEISEAFLKLREQARCHYQRPTDLQAGLEVINQTNLMYFSTAQKAEFYTLKGMFHARSGRTEEANQAFGQAVQLDMHQSKAWAEWGKYNDRMFKEVPNDMTHAANAVSCYLQSAGLYKNTKSRPLLARILWLLSVDDGSFTISRAFDTYKGEAAFWYWIPFIPQLCMSISQREVKQARYILIKIAHLYPQALFFHLRTTREDLMLTKKQAAMVAAARASSAQTGQATTANDPAKRSEAEPSIHDSPKKENIDMNGGQSHSSSISEASIQQQATVPSNAPLTEVQVQYQIRQPWEYVEEIAQNLKTGSPLLILSMETIVDQINQRFKATPEEEIYRLMVMLLGDAMQSYVMRMNSLEDNDVLSQQTMNNIARMGPSLSGQVRRDYEQDFIKSKPSHYEYIQRLQQWRDKYEKYLDARPRVQPLDLLSHYLTEFQYDKFDEVEVPGQYTEDKDNNQNFVRIQKFGAKFENCRTHGSCWRRFLIHGNDNSKTSFAVQLPSGRYHRREERVTQLFKIFNVALDRKKEARKRNLIFHLPTMISCSPTLRLLQNDSSYISLSDIYDQHCEEMKLAREDPTLMACEKVKKVLKEFKQAFSRSPSKPEYLNLKKEIFDEVVLKNVPDDIITRYMIRTMGDPTELWRMRKQFTLQVALASFMTYVMCLSGRVPARFHLSRSTGLMSMSELVPGMSNSTPNFASNDAVPFRFTPNMQNFIGPIFTKGILASGIMAIGRCLTEPEFDLEFHLCLFARDEVMNWLAIRGKSWLADMEFRNHVAGNIDGVMKRAEAMACKVEREQASQNLADPITIPVVQTVTNLISTATNPVQLMKMTETYYPWF